MNDIDNVAAVILQTSKKTGVDMYRYCAIEKELGHVRSAISTLDSKRGEFPRGTIIGDPVYWLARLQSIRGMAERYNFPRLRDQADELLDQILTLQH
ncbi:hypothetical protein LGN17_07315 [Burkholderia sp. AU30280]|uniref:hypothetical protein n=1 Tax=Burkholderia sp. AU30280 TaxID=2879628 RepID=UPI001CF33942|nr:hypothetical protein [Burkholderia sp. AU30280]MCA8272319.1 hypothetical protein [Burkholderia sp. AU30280]